MASPFASGALVFAEEFNAPTISFWEKDAAPGGLWRDNYGYGGSADYKFNDELQHYTGPYYRDHRGDFSDNNHLVGVDPDGTGYLSLTARKTANAEVLSQGVNYTSGMITTRGAEPWFGGASSQFSFQYGFVEMRADPSNEPGSWNAFWLLPSGGDGKGGWGYAEIDIMEVVGRENGQVFQAVHGATEHGRYASVNVGSEGYHTFGFNWAADYLTWYVDGVQTMQIATPADMHQPMVLIANQAVGGSWAGTPDFGSDGASDFKLDYIRVYAPGAPVPLAAPDVGERLEGSAGADTLFGLGGADQVFGRAGDDDLNGNLDNDEVFGDEGADVVRGGKGNDLVSGGAGDDPHVNGNMGNDVVHGDDGNDTVFGGQGDDWVHGDAGDDRVSGDAGADILVGGAGADRFVFGVGGGFDWISDFNAADGDRILLAPGTGYTMGSHEGQTTLRLVSGDVIGLVGNSGFSADWLVFG